ncbi:MAG: hypothetical protein GY869_07885, partial [Planctomycetes bacterium]|nr:hypothetical protein [Planctomycetota bacterium]
MHNDQNTDYIYVADTLNNAIVKLSFSEDPPDLSIENTWNKYIVPQESGEPAARILAKSDMSCVIKLQFQPDPGEEYKLFAPEAIAVSEYMGQTILYVVDTFNDRVLILQEVDNGTVNRLEFIKSFGESGQGDGQFDHPTGITVNSNGTVYVADTFNHRIQSFEPGGCFLDVWGGQGQATGLFSYPSGISCEKDSTGLVYVADT